MRLFLQVGTAQLSQLSNKKPFEIVQHKSLFFLFIQRDLPIIWLNFSVLFLASHYNQLLQTANSLKNESKI